MSWYINPFRVEATLLSMATGSLVNISQIQFMLVECSLPMPLDVHTATFLSGSQLAVIASKFIISGTRLSIKNTTLASTGSYGDLYSSSSMSIVSASTVTVEGSTMSFVNTSAVTVSVVSVAGSLSVVGQSLVGVSNVLCTIEGSGMTGVSYRSLSVSQTTTVKASILSFFSTNLSLINSSGSTELVARTLMSSGMVIVHLGGVLNVSSNTVTANGGPNTGNVSLVTLYASSLKVRTASSVNASFNAFSLADWNTTGLLSHHLLYSEMSGEELEVSNNSTIVVANNSRVMIRVRTTALSWHFFVANQGATFANGSVVRVEYNTFDCRDHISSGTFAPRC